jgi:hypothetical protein
MAGAAQAQLKIKQLVGERETQKSIDAIEENRAKREKELIAQREKLQAQSDKAAKNLTNAQNNATSAGERMNKVDQYQNEYQALVKQQARLDVVLEKDPTNKKALKDQQELVRGPLGDLAKRIAADSKGSDKVLATELKKIFTGSLIDKNGNSTAGGITMAYNGSMMGTPFYKGGDADTALKQDASAALAGAKAITGGKTLKDLYNAYMGIGSSGSRTKDTAIDIEGSYGKNTNKGGAEQDMKQKMQKDYNIQIGQFFKYLGQTYKMTDGNSFIRQAAAGGYISGPGTPTSDSIPAMLSNGEFVVNAKSAASFGYGNLESINKMAAGGLAARFDIPSYNTSSGMKQGGSESSTSNVTINATLNFGESPKNGRELWKEFKQIAKAEGAKVGENIVIGGSY